MKRIILFAAVAAVLSGAAHAQSWQAQQNYTYGSGPGGTPPVAAYGFPPYSNNMPNIYSPSPPVYQAPAPVYTMPPRAPAGCRVGIPGAGIPARSC